MSSRRSTERGASLIEILVAMAVLGITSAALLGAFVTMIRSSTLHRDQAQAIALLETLAERVRAAPFDECATDSAYVDDAGTLPAGWTLSATVREWDGIGYVEAPCDEGATDPFGLQDLQLVGLTITSPDRRTVEDIVFPKVAS